MDNLASGTRRFTNLLDAVAADGMDRPDISGLGPSVGDDADQPARSLTLLGLSVGDDVNSPSPPGLTTLGPSVGDDNVESDVRLKEDVHRIGTTVFGLPLYRFKYLGKPATYEGVMAQDVLQVMPCAVSRAADGYYRVNYRALGTSMRQVSA